MAGHKGSKYYNIFLNYKIWLADVDGKHVIKNDFFILLKSISSEGSISAAANNIGISYRKAWKLVKDSEEILNFKLIERLRGGDKGGKSNLTDEGFKLLEAYNELIKSFDKSIHDITRKFFSKINY